MQAAVDSTTERVSRPLGSRPEFLAVDFFCGAGGTTRGLIDAGGYVIAGIDKDAGCERTYVENNANDCIDLVARFLKYDIFPRSADYPAGQQRQLQAKLDELIPYYRSKMKGVPLLFAICAPCQPFTRLSRKQMSDKSLERRARDSNLLREACRFVRRYRPELVLSENVAGIDDPKKYGGVWDGFRRALEREGYATGSKVVCTSRFGVPQFRKRSILVAVRRECVRPERFADILEDELLVPEGDPNAAMVSVAQAIGHLPPIAAGEIHPNVPNHRTRALSDINFKRLAAAEPGQSNAYMEDTEHGDLTLLCHRRVNKRLKQRCFSDVYTRMSPDRPSPTITTKCFSISNGRFGHYDVRQVRALSLREAAILQSFPEDYVFYPGDEIEPIGRMIGNAVPPKLAGFYANYLVRSVAERRRCS